MVRADADATEVLKDDGDQCRIEIWRLQQTLTGHGLIAELAPSEPLLVVAGSPEDGTRTLTVRCDPRVSDEGRLWFTATVDGQAEPKPLADVTRAIDAVTGILGERRIRPDVTEVDMAELS
jgi:hypothetical protein